MGRYWLVAWIPQRSVPHTQKKKGLVEVGVTFPPLFPFSDYPRGFVL